MRIAALVFALTACSASPALSPRDCTPGATSACACPGASGVQACGADGTLGACVCADAGGTDAVSSRLDVAPLPDRPAPAPDVVDASVAPGADAAADAPELPDAMDAGELPPDVQWKVADAGCIHTDVQSDPLNCGFCGNMCPVRPNSIARCLVRSCSWICAQNFQNCDANATNGCETDLRTSARHCGVCGRECQINQVCRDSRCVSR